MMMIINIRLDDFQKIRLKNLRKNRCKRPVDDKDNDEMDFYYSRESQSFLERYYKDIYGDKNCRRKNLKRCEFVDIIS